MLLVDGIFLLAALSGEEASKPMRNPLWRPCTLCPGGSLSIVPISRHGGALCNSAISGYWAALHHVKYFGHNYTSISNREQSSGHASIETEILTY